MSEIGQSSHHPKQYMSSDSPRVCKLDELIPYEATQNYVGKML